MVYYMVFIVPYKLFFSIQMIDFSITFLGKNIKLSLNLLKLYIEVQLLSTLLLAFLSEILI